LRIFVAAISSNQVLYAVFLQTSKETHQADAYSATNLSRKKTLYMQQLPFEIFFKKEAEKKRLLTVEGKTLVNQTYYSQREFRADVQVLSCDFIS
jgi:hypothetical protein